MLRKNFFDLEQMLALARDHHQAGLEPAEVAMMDFAALVIEDPKAITQAEVDRLRAHGFADEEILDIVLTASARSFYARVLDALGAEPDLAYADQLEPELIQALTKGRPFPSTR